MTSEWCTIESDPGVFTELIQKFGVKDVQVEELWNMEEESFRRFRDGQVYGLIFLFKWDKDLQKSASETVLEDVPEGLFFARQMVTNACGTQAILNVLLNCEDRVELGETLTEFRSFSAGLDPDSIGLALEDSTKIRTAHNSFARPEPIQIEITESSKGEDAFHFISYVPKNGILYELDGLQKGPRLISECEDKAWWEVARPAIEKRMAEYGGDELRFTLLAVVQDLQSAYNKELASLAQEQTETAQQRVAELKTLIETEQEKKEKWKKENIRRRHNYFPFAFALLQALAQKNLLQGMTDRAQELKLKKIEEKKKQKEEKNKEKNAQTTTTTDSNTKDSDGDVQMTSKD